MPRLPSRAVLLLSFVTSGCSAWVLDPAGQVGLQERIILFDALAIMLAIVIPTILAILAFAYWYRAGNTRARHRPDFSYSGRLELLVWSIPTLVILFLGGIIWVGSHDLDPATALAGKALEVDVIALDWKWLFVYPQQGIATVNDLVMPVGQPVQFRLTSASVFNSFFVPRIGSQIYAMPGMTTQLNLVADKAGSFHGLSAQFSGDGFSNMGFTVHAVPPAEFAGWVGQVRRSGGMLDGHAYRGLLAQSTNVPVHTYGSVMPRLFEAVVNEAFPRGQGPSSGQPLAAVRPMGAH